MIALCSILAVVAVALTVATVRLRARIAALEDRDHARSREVTTVRAELASATARADDIERERDQALERGQRSCRDAAEVANRLTEATIRIDELAAANEDLSDRNRALVASEQDLRTRLDDLESHPIGTASPPHGAATAGSGVDGEVLWALTLGRVERRWRVSVAAGVEDTSPLMTSTSLLEDAIRVEVEAAREEAGALIALSYQRDGDDDVDGAAAATTIALVEELVAGVAKLADEGELVVTVGADAIVVAMSAANDGVAVEIPGPSELRDDAGRYRIERARRTADAG